MCIEQIWELAMMQTQTLARASQLLSTLLVDTIQVYDVGDPVTVGHEATRPLTPVGDPIPGLVQTTILANAVESRVENMYSIKVAQGTALSAGQAVRVVHCTQEPSLVNKVLLLDKVSQNGLALIIKAVASDFHEVNQEGKSWL